MSDSTNYWTRVKKMMLICGPPSWPSLLYNSSSILEAKSIIQSSTNGYHIESSKLELAKYITSNALHPDTGEIIPLPFRMAAHVPVNAVLLCGMLSSKSVLGTGCWQFLNQAFNAAQFYHNRNATTSALNDDTIIFASFLGAITGSVGVGVVLRNAALRAESIASKTIGNNRPSAIRSATIFGNCVPFLAAAAAKPLQISLMRQRELQEGVEVFDKENISRGNSRIAGQVAVTSTILTRTIYLAPMLWIPFIQSYLEKRITLLQTSRTAAILFYTMHCAFNSAFVTPLCIALFDQRASLPVEWLESTFQNLKTSGGDKNIERLYFNKGL